MWVPGPAGGSLRIIWSDEIGPIMEQDQRTPEAIMEKSNKRWRFILGAVIVIALILGGIIVSRGLMNRRAFDARPLVLIHQPVMMDSYQLGDGILVHATAREDQGLSRLEVWANEQLVKAVDAEEPWPTNMAISASWIPIYEGEQHIVVRAISGGGSAGQSTVQVLVSPADSITHEVREGENLASIAAEYGTSLERLSDLNPGLGGVAPAVGEEIIIPGGGYPTPAPPDPEEDDGDPPSPETGEPLLGYAFPLIDLFSPDPGNLTLRLEVPALRTWETYDGLHCYVSLGGSLPQWYPDLDNQQATDEYFEPSDHGWWITDEILVGDDAPIISWPGNEPLTMSFSCVGVRGGTEALELGQIDLVIPAEDWDGSTAYHESDGEGGHLLLVTKVTQLSGDPRNTPKYPDPDLPGPTNVRLNEEQGTLEWDYVPDEDEPIDGFRIYLNGSLQWSVDAGARSTSLPPEWFHPPCAWIYTFGVTSYRIEFPDGPESDPPAEFALEQPREGCMRLMRVTFLELQTFDLGEDGRHERRHGDVGPAYGTFYANESQVSFDHGYEGPGLDMVEGLRHNTTYDLAVVSGDPGWHFDGPNSIVAEVPFEGQLQLGFVIMDRDNNPDDQICEGFVYPIRDAWGQLDGYHQDAMTSENGRCRVTFEYEPTEDSPVGERYAGAEPLPWIDLAGYYVDEATGTAHVSVGNSGTAAWVDRDLTIEMQTRDGLSLGIATFEDFDLAVGETRALTHPIFDLEPPYDACVVIDPFDEVLEYYERSGALIHNPICQDLPDLVVEEAYFGTLIDNRFIVDVRNIGDGPLAYRTLVIEIRDAENRLLLDPVSISDVTIGAGRTERFELPAGIAVDRLELQRGWSVTLNPEATFVENNHENNTLQHAPGKELRLKLYGVDSPYGVRNFVEFHIDGYLLQGRHRSEQVINLDVNQDIDWGTCFPDDYCSLIFYWEDKTSDRFLIVGGESLEIVISINHPGSLWTDYSLTEIFSEPDWEAGIPNPSTHSCSHWPMRDDIGRHSHVWYHSGGLEWYLRYDLCQWDLEE